MARGVFWIDGVRWIGAALGVRVGMNGSAARRRIPEIGGRSRLEHEHVDARVGLVVYDHVTEPRERMLDQVPDVPYRMPQCDGCHDEPIVGGKCPLRGRRMV